MTPILNIANNTSIPFILSFYNNNLNAFFVKKAQIFVVEIRQKITHSFVNTHIKQEITNICVRKNDLGFWAQKEEDVLKNEANYRNKFEASLLRQIISLCHKREIPLSGLKLVPEDKTKRKRKALTILLCLDAIAICFVAFSDVISKFFHGIFGKNANLHSLHMFLYFLIIVISVIILGRIFFEFISITKLKEISAMLTASKSELSATAENVEYCLERNSLELTYIFEKLSQSYNAIVFEDMDRIHHKAAIDILTCLREINNTVNERLRIRYEQLGTIKKFIYVCKSLIFDYLAFVPFIRGLFGGGFLQDNKLFIQKNFVLFL